MGAPAWGGIAQDTSLGQKLQGWGALGCREGMGAGGVLWPPGFCWSLGASAGLEADRVVLSARVPLRPWGLFRCRWAWGAVLLTDTPGDRGLRLQGLSAVRCTDRPREPCFSAQHRRFQ